jgi:hypothetical protein
MLISGILKSRQFQPLSTKNKCGRSRKCVDFALLFGWKVCLEPQDTDKKNRPCAFFMCVHEPDGSRGQDGDSHHPQKRGKTCEAIQNRIFLFTLFFML